MQSQPVKRVVSCALAASAVVAVVTFQSPATASPNPAPQTPPVAQQPAPSDALEKYYELSERAEKLNEEHLQAQENLEAKQSELRQANKQLTNAQQAKKRAESDEERYRVDVDRFAGASFASGSQMNRLSALLTGDSAQDFLERSSALDVIATDRNRALSRLRGAVDSAAAAEKQAEGARNKAAAAKNAAAKLESDIAERKERLDEQIAEAEEAAGLLNDSEQASLQDTGADVGEVKAPGPAAQAAVDAALGKRGSPYVYGATGPDTFDCSGLTSWAYQQAGISIPRTASSQQSGAGTPVSRDQLQPGDLVFFGSPAYHVGIYVGNDQMVHAPTEGDVVKVSPLQEEYSGAARVA
ncbi:NlpC/P60 family protein [Prauserella rugosa]|uniref:Cell wall-associated NlpC family hydrolase n=1 Tax=Prauserella rugosa TaxID=43354 RepID=A0A660C9H7_9PSEU|nr:C40 family peptidase [Prauserella rugosa]KID30498.1 cell wall-associated hydrolase, invasion-associated protein [Prauserella sp. Am3]TWH20208.1 cell wall-associated NlpC family hydrolase [Prauserella rugosa]